MHVMSETQETTSDWGRVADDGTVYVRTSEGERVVGSWQAGEPAEGLAFFTRKYDALAGEVALLGQRLQAGTADPIATVIMGMPLAAALILSRTVRPRPTRLFPLASLLSFFVFPAVIWEQEGTTPTVVAGLVLLALIVIRRITAGLRDDLATGAPMSRVLANRALYDRSELQERGLVAI